MAAADKAELISFLRKVKLTEYLVTFHDLPWDPGLFNNQMITIAIKT